MVDEGGGGPLSLEGNVEVVSEGFSPLAELRDHDDVDRGDEADNSSLKGLFSSKGLFGAHCSIRYSYGDVLRLALMRKMVHNPWGKSRHASKKYQA